VTGPAKRLRRGALRAALLLLLLAVAAPLSFAVDPVELDDPVLQQRYRALSHELRCMQCQNQSIADSPVGLAGDLRREVRELLEAGKTDEQVRDHMRQRYGDFILFRPTLSLRNAWLWATPLVLLAIGIGVALRILRQRAALPATDDGDDSGNDRGGATT
jgi:cytochrome c-type biogenesis protein CcmH